MTSLRPILMTKPVAEAKSSPSPLGAQSSAYRVKTSEKGSILDNPELGLLEFYPAGYTKPDKMGGSKQDIYKALYETAVSRNKEAQLYPLGKDTHNVLLIPEFDNPHDPNAMIVRLTGFDDDKELAQWSSRDLGYIPMKISKVLAPNRGMITQGRILKVRNAVHGKYYSAKIVLSYSNEDIFSPMDITSSRRFSFILEE